jgi:hypothetical protein
MATEHKNRECQKSYRFCIRNSGGPTPMIDPDITMKRNREILENDRKAMATYKSIAEANADLELGGRYAKVTKTTVTGSGPISHPQLPEGNPFKCDPVGIEPPLGFSVEDQPATGEPHEILRSLSSAAPDVSEGDRPAPVPIAGSRPVTPKFRRRI